MKQLEKITTLDYSLYHVSKGLNPEKDNGTLEKDSD